MRAGLFKSRLNVVTLVILILFASLLSRLWYLQVLAGEEFTSLAEGNRVKTVVIPAPRGLIEDRQGRPIVTNRGAMYICLLPKSFQDLALLGQLSRVVNKPVAGILSDTREARKTETLLPIPISEQMDLKAVTYIREHEDDFPGVSVQVRPVRNFRYSNMASHVLGYVGEISDFELREKQFVGFKSGDMIGKAGLEKTYDSFLRGRDGEKNVEVNARGKAVRNLSVREPEPGVDLVLSIDPAVQKATEAALPYGIKLAHADNYTEAEAATAIVMDPKNGEIIAMASYPTYSPKIFTGGISNAAWSRLNSRDSNYPLNNRAILGYPIGSIMKPITAIGALSDNLATPDTMFLCTGKWTGPTKLMQKQRPKYCWNRLGHGRIDFNRAIVDSCDVVFYELGYKFYKMGSERLQWWSRMFGLGHKTGIDLPNEKRGRVPTKAWKKNFNADFPQYQTWYPGDTINMGIGQGDLLVSPVQVARFFSAVANGGYLLRPHLVRRIETSEGRIIRQFYRETSGKIPCSQMTLKAVQNDLRNVVTRGTAVGAFYRFPVSVAGKTGTAQVKGKDDFAWFACYSPIRDPKYVVVVMVEQGGHGSSTAAPVARKILESLYHIKPTVETLKTKGD